jgi:cytochrome c oxidase cbb3-type subunit 3
MTQHRSDPETLPDHEPDGIREFDNALPRWWLYGFYFTIAFAVVYMVNYHLLPRPLFGQPGMIAEYEAEVAAAARSLPKADGLASSAAARPQPSAAVALVARTDEQTLAQGRVLFEGTDGACFSCHRQDLGGLVGPNLTDDLWLHGCGVGDLVANIKSGFPQKGMLPYGVGKPMSDDQLLGLASYILSKRGSSPANPKPIDPERDKACQ